MNSPLQVLHLEDNAADTELIQATLDAEGLQAQLSRVEAEDDFIGALEDERFDLILADYTLPSFDGLSALRIAQQRASDIPFIFVSGTLGEDIAIEALKTGATDYVLKTRLSRLVPSVRRALREAEERAERKKAEEALRRSERELREVIETIPAIVWSALPDASNVMMSKRWAQYTGVPATGLGWQAAAHPDDLERHLKVFRACSAAGVPFADEVRFRSADGEYRWFFVQGTPLRDEQGNILKWYGIVTDIEDRKRAEQTLRQQANLLSLTHDAIFVRDLNGVIKYWNRGAENLYGWTAEQAVGQVAHEFLKTIFPMSFHQVEEELKRTGRWVGELVHTKRDGTTVNVASRWALQRDDKGVPIAILVTNTDISARKRAEEAREEIEEQWRAAFESNPTIYFMLDEAGKILSINPFGAEQLGYSVDELVGQSVLNVLYEPDRAAVQGHAEACFQRLGRATRWEARKIRKDGTMLWVRETANAVSLKKRPVLLVVCEDITEQKRAEEIVRQSERELRDVINTIPANVWSTSTDGAVDFINQRWRDFTGLAPEEALGWHWKNAVHPDDLSKYLSDWGAALTNGQSMQTEIRVRRANGEYRWMWIRNVPIRDELGNVRKWYGTGIDIEDRKRAEEKISRSEAELRQLIDVIPQQVFVFDADWSPLFANQRERQYTGLTLEEMQSKDAVARIFHPEDQKRLEAFRERAVLEAVPCETEARIRGRNGQYRWFLIQDNPLRDEQGRVLRWYGTRTDIEDRKRAEEELRESERRYRYIFQAAGVSIWEEDFSQVKAVIDDLKAQGIQDVRKYTAEHPEFVRQTLPMVKVIDVNDATLKLFAAGSKHELLVSLDKVLGLIPVHDPEIEEVMRGELIAIAEGQTSFESEKVAQTLHGDKLTVLFTITFPPQPSKLDRVLVSIIDITKRKQAENALRESEERLRLALDAAQMGQWDWNIITGEFVCSEKSLALYGLPPDTPMSYDRFLLAVHPEDRQHVDMSLRRAVEHRTSYDETKRIVWPDGSIHWTNSRAQVYCDPAGKPIHMIGVTFDITEEKQAEEALEKTQAELAHVARLTTMGELTSSIAHEVNQPLTAIVTSGNACLRWLSNEPPNVAEARELVSRIVKDGHRASDVVGRIRGFFKKTPPEKVSLEINHFIKDVIAMVTGELNRNRVQVKTELAVDLPPVIADPIQLQQVLLNLVINSIEAMSKIDRARELLIKSERYQSDSVLVAVQDNGAGFDEQMSDQLFEAFYTTKPNGLGLGLSISRTTIEAYGGRLWAATNNGGGATFQFTLPAK